MSKIELHSTGKDIMDILGEGDTDVMLMVRGIMEHGSKIDTLDAMGGVGTILMFDDMELYGKDLKNVWEFCDKKLGNIMALSRSVQLGFTDRGMVKMISENPGTVTLDMNTIIEGVCERLVREDGEPGFIIDGADADFEEMCERIHAKMNQTPAEYAAEIFGVVNDIAGGNPGALTFCMAIVEQHGIEILKQLKEVWVKWELKEHLLYGLWNDICKRDLQLSILFTGSLEYSDLDKETLHTACQQYGKGVNPEEVIEKAMPLMASKLIGAEEAYDASEMDSEKIAEAQTEA